MPIQGSLDEVSLADVLQLLALGKKTGCLSLNDGAMQGHIYLNAGRICYAAVVDRRDRVGDVLVKAGKITKKQLDEAVERQAHERTTRLGEILVGSGRVARAELDRFVRAQVQEAVSFMFTWKQGSFTYQSRVRPEQADFLVSLNPGAILLEAARRVDEWSQLKKKIPSFDIVFRIDEAPLAAANVTLTDEQRRILPFLDGSRDVLAIVEATGLGEFVVAKALYGLITAGFARLVERRSVMRHLTYREFLAYLVSEAEFADPAWRSNAERHIAHCSLCTKRLKKIHRRTGEVVAVEEDVADTEVERRKAKGTCTSPAPPTVAGKRSATSEEAGQPDGDRRSGSDRRQDQRRWGERRLAARPGLSASWPVEQRRGADRRKGDRRKSQRRGGKKEGSGGGTVAGQALDGARSEGEVPAVTPPPNGRSGNELPPSERPTVRVFQKDIEEAAASAEEASTPEPRQPAASAPKPASKGKDTGSTVSTQPPRRRRSSDIEWLVSPDDAVELLRQGRPKAPPASTSKPARTTPGPPPERAPSQVAPPEAAAGQAVTPERAPSPAVPSQHTRVTRPVAAPDRPMKEKRWTRQARSTQPVVQAPGPTTKEIKGELRTPATEPAAARGQRERVPGDEAVVTAKAEPQRPLRDRFTTSAAVRTMPVADRKPERTDRAAGVPESSVRVRRPSWAVVAATFVIAAGLGWIAGVFTNLGPAEGSETAAAAVGSPRLAEPSERSVPADSGLGAPPPAVGGDPATRPVRGDPDVTSESVRSAALTGSERESGERRGAEGPTPGQPTREIGSPSRRSEEATVVASPSAGGATVPPVGVGTPELPPRVGSIRGKVLSATTGEPLAGVRVSLQGAGPGTRTDAFGLYELGDIPHGAVTIEAVLDGYLPGTVEVVAEAGVAIELDVTLRGPPRALEPDTGLTVDGWLTTSRAEATDILGQPIAVIPGLWIESIATPAQSSRPRVRVALLTASGERVVLVESRSGGFVRGGPARVTALRIMPASEAFPITTGTASFGTLLVTAKTGLSADSLRGLLGRLRELPGAAGSDVAP